MKNIFFDLDGTLVNSSEGITKGCEYALKHFEINIDDRKVLEKFIGPPLSESFMKYYNLSLEQAKEAVIKYREYYSAYGVKENALYTGIKELLQDLSSKGNDLIVATSKPKIFTEQILEQHNIKQYFKFISGATLDGALSKKEDIIKHAINELKINNMNDCIMIGDTKFDIIGAKLNNIKSIGVKYGFGSNEELQEATYIAKDVEELRNILDIK